MFKSPHILLKYYSVFFLIGHMVCLIARWTFYELICVQPMSCIWTCLSTCTWVAGVCFFHKWNSFIVSIMFFNSVFILRLWFSVKTYFNPFVPNETFLYPLKTSENLTVFWCFQGVEKICIGREWVLSLIYFFI